MCAAVGDFQALPMDPQFTVQARGGQGSLTGAIKRLQISFKAGSVASAAIGQDITKTVPLTLIGRASRFLSRRDSFCFLISLSPTQRKDYLLANPEIVLQVIESVRGDLNKLPIYLRSSMTSREVLKTVTTYPFVCTSLDELRAVYATFPFLQKLRAKLQGNLEDKDIKALIRYKNLQSLELSDGHSVTDQSALSIGQMPELRELTIDSASMHGITVQFLSFFPIMRKLTKLDLGYLLVTDQTIQNLKKFPELIELELRYCTISDQGISALAALTKLQKLRIGFLTEHPTQEGISELVKGCSQLEVLYITNVTSQGVAHLATLTRLRELSLCHSNRVTNDGVALLAASSQLIQLSLIACPFVNNDFLDVLISNRSAFPHLNKLKLLDCPITEEKCEELTKVRPWMEISCDWTVIF